MASRNPRYAFFLLNVFVISLLSTSCYTYETLEFDINIPEQAESSIVIASDGTLITTLVAPENRTSARRLEEIPEIARVVRTAYLHRTKKETSPLSQIQMYFLYRIPL